MLDLSSQGKVYPPYLTDDLASGKLRPATDFTFPFLTRHGSAPALSGPEYARLKQAGQAGAAAGR